MSNGALMAARSSTMDEVLDIAEITRRYGGKVHVPCEVRVEKSCQCSEKLELW